MAQKRQELQEQIDRHRWLTDGGLETVLIFDKQVDLPCFAAFDVLSRDWGETLLRGYYQDYLALARRHRTGFMLEAPTWRASPDWGSLLGYSDTELARANRQSVELLQAIRRENPGVQPILISGNLGPRGDGYQAGERMTTGQAQVYHAWQIGVLAEAGVDLINALTIAYIDEALGIARAAQAAEVPLVLSFTLETDGRLPSGEDLGDAIRRIDAATDGYPLYYMINCAHPSHFESMLAGEGAWRGRIRGLRGNASKCSHQELDEAQHLDNGDPRELGQDYRRVSRYLPELRVFGGCCGTDHRHIHEIAEACV